ncbi:protein SpAN [Patella vulgata]|uniref:protein SpAN n=1 Tax=Patella vulgata TaxID=6465 RepID=UPI0024A8BAD5|nr:protein SpAN [Patella vulgata]
MLRSGANPVPTGVEEEYFTTYEPHSVTTSLSDVTQQTESHPQSDPYIYQFEPLNEYPPVDQHRATYDRREPLIHSDTYNRHGHTVRTESQHTVTQQTQSTTISRNSESRHVVMRHPIDPTSILDMLSRESRINRTAAINSFLAKEELKKASHSIDNDILSAYGGYNSYSKIKESSTGHIMASLDMWLTKEQVNLFGKSGGRVKRKSIRPKEYRWTNAIIPYTIESSFRISDLKLIKESMRVWEAATCIRFRQAVDTDKNVVTIINGPGCSSHVGMIGGKQDLTLHINCRKKAIVVHELGHAIGMIHEHQRPDRAEFVSLNKQNAMPGTEADFQMYSWDVIDSIGIKYDYRSIMHYGGTAFAKDNGVTIKTRDPRYQDIIGKATTISQADIETVSGMYECPARRNRVPAQEWTWLNGLLPSNFEGQSITRERKPPIRDVNPRGRIVQPSRTISRQQPAPIRRRVRPTPTFNRNQQNFRPTNQRNGNRNDPWMNDFFRGNRFSNNGFGNRPFVNNRNGNNQFGNSFFGSMFQQDPASAAI